MTMFARMKADHEIYGHDVWIEMVKPFADVEGSPMVFNVCTDLGCKKVVPIQAKRILPGILLEEILNNACSNPAYLEIGDNTFGDQIDEGFNVYRIETHCVAYEILAKKVMGHWFIKSYEKKDC